MLNCGRMTALSSLTDGPVSFLVCHKLPLLLQWSTLKVQVVVQKGGAWVAHVRASPTTAQIRTDHYSKKHTVEWQRPLLFAPISVANTGGC